MLDEGEPADNALDNGFCIWITEADEKVFGFRLFRAYEKLLKEHGMKSGVENLKGSNFKGVKTIEEFYGFYVGKTLPKTNCEWLEIPDFYLAEATDGKVFFDNLGEFTRIRNYLLNDRPEDVRIKKLASALFYAAQSGQYNYSRCISHGEYVAAGLALSDFIKSAMNAAFLINRKYAPYYKWTFRALKGLENLSCIADPIEKLASAPYNEKENVALIENVCAAIIGKLVEFGYTQKTGDYLEPYAYKVNDLIIDGNLRNDPIML